MTPGRPALAVLAGVLLAGCAALPVPTRPDGSPLDTVVRLTVPFFPDDSDQCGPSALAGGLDSIRLELDSGRPVIAFVDAGIALLPVGHYIVITGYDDRRRRLFAHSGMKRDLGITYDKFKREWKAAGQWALLIRPAAQ